MNVVRRLSLALAGTKQPVLSASSDVSVAQFLASTKEKYLADIQAGNGQEWTVAMGNEAGDLDSVASCIAVSWIRSIIQHKPTVPLVQIQREDLHLRAENIYALKLAGIDKPGEQLLLLNDLKDFTPFPSTNFALVDHNRLVPPYADVSAAKVLAVIDHHEDEHLYEDAEPRIIAPAGSCSSHIAHLCPSDLPEELANLLLSAIVIDTAGLAQGGKAIKVDYEAAAFLLPKSSWRDSVPSKQRSQPSESLGGPLEDHKVVKSLNSELARRKTEVSHLSGQDLLRRDYKEYSFSTSYLHPAKPVIKAGLSTVPAPLETWGNVEKLQTDAQTWMKQRNLTILGILTTFRGSPKKASAKGKHRREMAWIIRTDADVGDGYPAEELNYDELATKLWNGLEANDEISVKTHKAWSGKKSKERLGPSLRIKVYKQKNARATRKAVAPLLRAIMEAD